MTLIRVGTRGSALALWQARHVAARLHTLAPHVTVELVEITSTGDRITDVPLTEVEGTGFFTATLERALADGRVDLAVHSYKDLPIDHTSSLVVAAVPPRGPVEDVLCVADQGSGTRDQGSGDRGSEISPSPETESGQSAPIPSLRRGARVGTCSARRTAQLRARRPDLDLRALRGNVPTRIAKLAAGELDAIVLARAGLVRLGLEAHITEVFPATVMLPAPAQGALAIQCRAADRELAALLRGLDDEATRRAVDAERMVLHALGGGCSVPVGATAAIADGALQMTAGVFALDEPRRIQIEVSGFDPNAVGHEAARRLLDLGAGEILASFGKVYQGARS